MNYLTRAKDFKSGPGWKSEWGVGLKCNLLNLFHIPVTLSKFKVSQAKSLKSSLLFYSSLGMACPGLTGLEENLVNFFIVQ